MNSKIGSNNTYSERKLKYVERQYNLLENANSEIEQKFWSNELLLFHKNYIITNQIEEIKKLKATIDKLQNAKSVKIARFIKGHLLGFFRRKRQLNFKEEKSFIGDFNKNVNALEKRVSQIKIDDDQSKFDRIWINQLPNKHLLKKYKTDLLENITTPKISIILPVYKPNLIWLSKAINSVVEQIYQNWELCIVDDCSSNSETEDILNHFERIDDRIKVLFNEQNYGISRSSNRALSKATGDYITFLDHDDFLSPNALFEVYQVINEEGADFIYSDEALVNPLDQIVDGLFKPDFSPDFLLSLNYINHLMVIKKSLIEKTGGFQEGLEGSQDYDVALKNSEVAKKICHIPKILYFWRLSSGTFSATATNKRKIHNAGKKAIESALKRRAIDAEVFQAKRIYNYHVKRKIKNNPMVSIIIPFKDKADVLTTCIESILFNTTYNNFEIIGISNNSKKKDTFKTMEQLELLDKRVRFHKHDISFNYSEINNYGATLSTGEHLLLMNNDIEIINKEWLEELLQHSQCDDVGAVGGKLYYPNNTIQHAGVILGISGFAGHSHRHFPRERDGSINRLVNTCNVSAVTGALLLVKKRLYEEVGGLDQDNLQIALNDVDFCLKLREKGYINIFTPFCEAYHHESATRGYDTTIEQKRKFNQERDYFMNKWSNILEKDPYYNINLTLEREDFSLMKEGEMNNKIDSFSFAIS